ncbi:uncharacterized protein PHALS_08200 [Plasmopara halstedii]|uniref:Uncharacterized protein n=1 Tax=Plasmopara halstedii TaxID=4781 RepID=A0A0P1ACD8_PLAHL|nr:uncharacterized protein PHALS_08200 [Plasmopara halstedii]CEG38106.1 hypothetical protein PHALS_08200 [Plasmopara halstedii]|eukprot:XP_024574475.1 hypothetical protein PHALS_08200 [Plasmopara halstedii]
MDSNSHAQVIVAENPAFTANGVPNCPSPFERSGQREQGSSAICVYCRQIYKIYNRPFFFERKAKSENGNPARFPAPGTDLDSGSRSVPNVHKNPSRFVSFMRIDNGMAVQSCDKTLRGVT